VDCIVGGFAVGWALLATRRLIPQMAVLGAVQFVVTIKADAFINRISTTFDPGSDPALLKRTVLTDVGIASVLLFGSFLLMSEFQRREGIRYHATHTEMRLATEIHRSLVPEVSLTIGDFEFYGCSRPSGEVGGDVLDVIESKGEWFAYVADVSGHGVAAGVLMSMVKSAARMRVASAGAEGFLEKMNDVLAPLSDPAMYATLGCVWPIQMGSWSLLRQDICPLCTTDPGYGSLSSARRSTSRLPCSTVLSSSRRHVSNPNQETSLFCSQMGSQNCRTVPVRSLVSVPSNHS